MCIPTMPLNDLIELKAIYTEHMWWYNLQPLANKEQIQRTKKELVQINTGIKSKGGVT